MSQEETRERCAATTKAGTQCKRLARPGEAYCTRHVKTAGESVPPAPPAPPAPPVPSPDKEHLQLLVQELEELVAELKTAVPAKSQSLSGSMGAERLTQFMKSNLDRVTPELAKDIAASFQGATAEDLMDPDTWKGLAYMLNYSLRFQAEQLKQRLLGENPEE